MEHSVLDVGGPFLLGVDGDPWFGFGFGMKIAAVCCTYLRPKWLGWMIRCFEKQDYPNRELVILDDAGQYDTTHGDRWTLVSTKMRYRSLGEKRNAAADLVSDDVEALAIWDDDDLYLPWALTATSAALEHADWSRPSIVLHPGEDGMLQRHETDGCFNSAWGFRRAAYNRIGGYPPRSGNEDDFLARKLVELGVTQADPMALGYKPFLVYPWRISGPYRTRRLSTLSRRGWEIMGKFKADHARVEVSDPGIDLDNPRMSEDIQPRTWGGVKA